MNSSDPYRSRSLPRSIKPRVQYTDMYPDSIQSFHSLRDFAALQNGDDYRRYPLRWQGQAFFPPAYRVPKGLLLTFFHNGDAFSAGIKVSMRPGKDFQNYPSFCDYLTQKLKVPYGVRYIFEVGGPQIPLKRLDEFRDGASYVVSAQRHYVDIAYGLSSRMRTAFTTSRPKYLRADDLRLLRPPTPAHLREIRGIHRKIPEHIYYKGADQSVQVRTLYSESGPTVGPTAGYKEGRIMTVVNGLNHGVRSRVLLNLKTTKNYEGVLKDLGQAVGLDKPKRLYTPWGQEVMNFSQLKYEYRDVETFYLDDIDYSQSKNRPNSPPNTYSDSERLKYALETRINRSETPPAPPNRPKTPPEPAPRAKTPTPPLPPVVQKTPQPVRRAKTPTPPPTLPPVQRTPPPEPPKPPKLKTPTPPPSILKAPSPPKTTTPPEPDVGTDIQSITGQVQPQVQDEN